jgi:hypothetical protein
MYTVFDLDLRKSKQNFSTFLDLSYIGFDRRQDFLEVHAETDDDLLLGVDGQIRV